MGWTHDLVWDFVTFVEKHPVVVAFFSLGFLVWGHMLRKAPKEKEDA